ncbi:hypothetical protein [Novosphingobium pentaromativorans]|uniref:Uncharacterized protein n=1 Tax=Novosphingobium pentaromativorans US6-1 TaxID=1088721 RepID=G6E8W3_9SPHN|nr:hypothetical protein [Novosphingobium pentaromativorans]AIT81207.1 hypothetical protein JI59_16170 [Novosphingobium pentaromativorans US6-1]EHJ62187.1 hypothetical protein NSU_0784 [Novosphingobium pentaromativorans US6-1]
MGYEVTIRCDDGKGDPVGKRQCVTYARSDADKPRREAATSRDAVYAVEKRAKAAGWKLIRRAGHPARWVCPVCQGSEPSNISG